MRLSKLNIKKINLNDLDKNYVAQDILIKLGELYQFESGIYGYGNIWNKLQRNIESIIIEELDKADCIQVDFPKLQPKKIWVDSERWNIFTDEKDIMFALNNNLGEYGLAPTAEECAALFGANRLKSYKNLPATYYQIGEKFRKEIRTRGYLFRPRTFTMMDAYSFDISEEKMHEKFKKMHEVYLNIFKRLGINIVPVVSDGGTMGGRVSEEYQGLTNLGEDTIIYDEKNNIGLNKEVLEFEDKETFIKAFGVSNLENLKEYKAIELGNNFELGTKYTDAMHLNYIDENGESKPYYMGCYGLGVGRILAYILENNVIRNANGIKGFSIPYKLAPYKVQIICSESNKDEAEKLYKYLMDSNINTIIDDREDLSIGNRILDVYVLGTPKMIILGNKFDGINMEIEDTKTSKKITVEKNQILEFFNDFNELF